MNTEWKPIPASLYDLICTGDLEALLWRLNGVRAAEEVRMALYNARKAILDAEEHSDCTPAPTSHPIPTGATGEAGRSATYGMTLGERIAHVGGRTNAQSYTEFGSPMAVNALIQHVLRAHQLIQQRKAAKKARASARRWITKLGKELATTKESHD